MRTRRPPDDAGRASDRPAEEGADDGAQTDGSRAECNGTDRHPAAPRRHGSAASRIARGLIRGYALLLSPFLGRNCRYLPTCSAYGDEAIARYGLWYGGFITLARLCRCHPFGASGFDPVPETLPKSIRWWSAWRAGRWGAKHIDPATRLDLGGKG